MEHHAHEASEVGFPRPEGAAAVLIEFPASQTLERNLAVLANRNAELVRKIRHTQPAHLEWSTAADGLRVAAHDGRALASRHAPRKEAEAFADLIDYQERAAAAVLGFGVGHHVAAI
jgi:hypothetical protein